MSITCDITGGVAVLTLDDGKANAMNHAFFDALDAALDAATAAKARAVVIVGRPGRFSGGMDLRVLPTLSPSEVDGMIARFGRLMLRVFGFPIPTVAAVTGHAVGGGAVLAFAADRRVGVAGGGKIHLNEVAIGLPLPSWAIAPAASAIPPRWHTALMLHAEPLTHEEAHARGILDALAPEPGALLDAALALAAPLKMLDPNAYAVTKQRLRGPAIAAALAVLDSELPGASR